MEQQTEKLFYQSGPVTVSQSRFVTSSQTYAMRNISSVSIFTIKKSKIPQTVCIAAGLLLMLSKAVLPGIIVAAIGITWLLLTKDEYTVRISTNAGETNSVTSHDKEYIQKIVNALNEAIVFRG